MSVPVFVLSLVLITSGAATADASALPDPTAAKSADKCQATILKANAKFVSGILKSHEKCYDAVFKCVQTKPGDQKCLDKAEAKCRKEIQARREKDVAKLLAGIRKKCPTFDDLASADGLGYGALTAACVDAGFPLSGINNLTECVRALTECDAEQIFTAQLPRARALAFAMPFSFRNDSCLGAGLAFGLDDVGDPKELGKALDKCQKQVKKAGAKFVKNKLKSYSKCLAALFKCKQTKPGDPTCVTKAQKKCDKEIGEKIPKAETKLAADLAKRCEEIFPQILPGNAMYVDVLEFQCQQLGVPALATMDDYETCLVRRHECLVDDIVGYTVPRANTLLQEIGYGLHDPDCGPTPTPTVSPTATPTVTPTSTVEPSPTPSFTPAPGEFAVIVNMKGAGTGTVTSDPPAIDCPSTTCAASFAPSTAVTLEARTTNGSNAQFNYWDGECTDAFWDCDVVTDQTRVVDARFGTLDHNLIFMSSVGVAKDLAVDPNDPIAPYDTICNDLATAAGLNNGAGNAYLAFLSADSPSGGAPSANALDRLGSARGFIRGDGKPFGDLPSDFTSTREIFHPVLFDETGFFDPIAGAVATGTADNGSTASTCDDWTSTSAGDFFTRADYKSGPGTIAIGVIGCQFGDPRIFCVMNTETDPIVHPPKTGKVIFMSNSGLTIPGDDPDAKCEADKPAGTGAVKALLATTTTPASAHLDAGTTYQRPDGFVIGTGAEIIAVATAATVPPLLDSGLWQSGNGTYPGAFVWTGQSDINAVGTVASTCNDWTDSAGTGDRGSSPAVDLSFWQAQTGDACSSLVSYIYCVEQ